MNYDEELKKLQFQLRALRNTSAMLAKLHVGKVAAAARERINRSAGQHMRYARAQRASQDGRR